MFEILMYLFESYFDAGSYPEPDKLSRKLTAAGFDDEDINDALSWLSGLQQSDPSKYPTELSHAGIRHFAVIELESTSMEARQFLSFTHQQKMISTVEREMIIDRAVALNQPNLSLEKMKLIMLMVLWNRHKDLDALLIEELLTPFHSKQLH